MKIQKIQSSETNNKRQGIGNANNKMARAAAPLAAASVSKMSFKGGIDALNLFWDAIGRGGFAANFVLQDVCGNNIPRTVIAFNRGKKETGKINMVEGSETAIREFTSGPSMFVTPALVLTAITGKNKTANYVPFQNIGDFSEIMKKTVKEAGTGAAPETIKEAFYRNILNNAAEHSFGGEKDFAEKFLGTINKVENGEFKKRNLFQKMFNVDLKSGEAHDQVISKLEGVFSKTKQEKCGDYTADFLSAKIAKNGKETKFADLLGQMKNYWEDFNKNVHGKLTQSADPAAIIDKFKNSRVGLRFVSGILLAASTALVMILIPKVYKAVGKMQKEKQEAQEAQGANKAGGAA